MTTIADTTNSTRARVEDLVQKVLAGKALDAFDAYYADDVAMQENSQLPLVGKQANRVREEQFFSTIEEFHNAEVPNVVVEGELAVIRWKMDVTTIDGTRMAYDQLALQTWRDGRIVSEQFFYDTATMVVK